MGHLIMVIEKLSSFIDRGSIYERLYRPEIIPADALNGLYEAMIKYYVEILGMIALCHRFLAKSTVKRTAQALFNPDQFAEFLKKCKDLEEKFQQRAEICESTRSQKADAEGKKLLMILREPILRTDNRVLELLEKTEKRECMEILDWMSDVPYGFNQKRVNEQRTADTCQWLLRHDRYQEWQDTSASTILWLHGNRK